jgi:hypothetical protein
MAPANGLARDKLAPAGAAGESVHDIIRTFGVDWATLNRLQAAAERPLHTQ